MNEIKNSVTPADYILKLECSAITHSNLKTFSLTFLLCCDLISVYLDEGETKKKKKFFLYSYIYIDWFHIFPKLHSSRMLSILFD